MQKNPKKIERIDSPKNLQNSQNLNLKVNQLYIIKFFLNIFYIFYCMYIC